MGAQRLSSRAIIGQFYLALEQNVGASWVGNTSMYFESDQESEEYAWLGQAPAMREWVGGRHAKGLRDNGVTVKNKKWEATLEILVDWIRRDKTGQIALRINEMARRANTHWAKLLSTLIEAAESSVCYDGQFFYDTDHSEGDSGTQSNDLALDISAYSVSNHGTPTAPSPAEMQQAVLNVVQQILGFKDDQGEPMNEDATDFLVMVPTSLWHVGATAIGAQVIDSGDTNVIKTTSMDGFNIGLSVNPRLTWTDKFAVFTSHGQAAAFIRQEEEPVRVDAVAEGSELEFNEDVHHYGLKAMRNVGYGFWQKSCLGTMI